MQVSEPLDPEPGLCGSERPPGGRALPTRPVSRPGSRRGLPGGSLRPPFVLLVLASRGGWRCPGAKAQAVPGLLFAFPCTMPSQAWWRRVWGQVYGERIGKDGCPPLLVYAPGGAWSPWLGHLQHK